MLSGQIELGDHQSQPKIHPLCITEKRASNTNTSDDATPSNLVQVAWGKISPIGDNNDDNPGQPVRRHQPWAWGEDSRDAGEESQWLSQLYRLSQVLEKFMSTVPENTNYQQQVLFESTFKAASWPSAQRCCRCTSLARATRRSPTPASTEWCASTPTRTRRSNKRNGTWSRCEYSLVLLAQCTRSEVVEEVRRPGWFRDRLTSLNAPVDASWLILVERECEA